MTLAVLVISIFMFLGKIAGFIKEVLIAKYWGVSGGVDAFKVVYNSIVFLVYSKIEKLLRPTYLPIFVKYREAGEEGEGWRFASIVATLSFVVMSAITAACLVFAPVIIRLGWPEMGSADQKLAVSLLRISGGAMLMLVMSVMTELTLHAYKRFTAPALADAMMKLTLMLAIGGLIGFGIYPADEPRGIKAAAIGVLAGGTLRLLLQIPALWGKLRGFVPSLRISHPQVLRMLSLMPPVIVGIVFSSARTYFDSRFSTYAGEGVYTALDFGRKVSDMVILIMPLAVSLVVYPYLSEWAARDDRKRLADSLVAMTRAMAFIFVPIAVGLMLLALPAVQFVYQDAQGAFTYDDAVLVRRGVVAYAAGIPFFAVEGSINKWYFALSDTATPNYVGAAMAVLHILIGYIGVYRLRRNVGVLALALTVSKGLKVALLYGLLRGRIGEIDSRAVYLFAAKLVISTAVMAVVIVAVGPQFSSLLVDAGRLQRLIYITLCGSIGAVAYGITAAILRIEELSEVAGYVKSKLRRGK